MRTNCTNCVEIMKNEIENYLTQHPEGATVSQIGDTLGLNSIGILNPSGKIRHTGIFQLCLLDEMIREGRVVKEEISLRKKIYSIAPPAMPKIKKMRK